MPIRAYLGTEEGVDLTPRGPVEPDSFFEIRAPEVPADAVPIFDDDMQVVIGYSHQCTRGVFRLYDLQGNVVGMEETPLKSPLMDPLDLIFLVGGLFRAIGRGVITGAVRTAPKVAAVGAPRIAARGLAVAVTSALRSALQRLTERNLKFTVTTAAHMAEAGRHVPVQILQLAIKYGKRAADPQGVKGAYIYTTKMLKNGKEYLLEVVLREKDLTVLHFQYWR